MGDDLAHRLAYLGEIKAHRPTALALSAVAFSTAQRLVC
jgi:hypothetical protein